MTKWDKILLWIAGGAVAGYGLGKLLAKRRQRVLGDDAEPTDDPSTWTKVFADHDPFVPWSTPYNFKCLEAISKSEKDLSETSVRKLCSWDLKKTPKQILKALPSVRKALEKYPQTYPHTHENFFHEGLICNRLTADAGESGKSIPSPFELVKDGSNLASACRMYYNLLTADSKAIWNNKDVMRLAPVFEMVGYLTRNYSQKSNQKKFLKLLKPADTYETACKKATAVIFPTLKIKPENHCAFLNNVSSAPHFFVEDNRANFATLVNWFGMQNKFLRKDYTIKPSAVKMITGLRFLEKGLDRKRLKHFQKLATTKGYSTRFLTAVSLLGSIDLTTVKPFRVTSLAQLEAAIDSLVPYKTPETEWSEAFLRRQRKVEELAKGAKRGSDAEFAVFKYYNRKRPLDPDVLKSEDTLAQKNPEWAIREYQNNYEAGKNLHKPLKHVLNFLARQYLAGRVIVVHGRDGEILHDLLRRMGVPSRYVMTPRTLTNIRSYGGEHLTKEQRNAYSGYLRRICPARKGQVHVDTGYTGRIAFWLRSLGIKVTGVWLVSSSDTRLQIPDICNMENLRDQVVDEMERRPQRLLRPEEWGAFKTVYGPFPGAYWARVYGVADALGLPRFLRDKPKHVRLLEFEQESGLNASLLTSRIKDVLEQRERYSKSYGQYNEAEKYKNARHELRRYAIKRYGELIQTSPELYTPDTQEVLSRVLSDKGLKWNTYVPEWQRLAKEKKFRTELIPPPKLQSQPVKVPQQSPKMLTSLMHSMV